MGYDNGDDVETSKAGSACRVRTMSTSRSAARDPTLSVDRDSDAAGVHELGARHVEILVSQMGLGDESTAVSTLGVRTDDDDGKECDAENRACYRLGRCGPATSVKTGVSCSSQ